MRAVLGCLLLGLTGTALAQPNSCVILESRAESKVQLISMAADELGGFRALGDEALADLRECPKSGRLWYLAARSAEILEDPTNPTVFAAEGGLRKIVANALQHAPASAAVVTVAARVEASAPLARKAVALDPNYQPARRALADLLAKQGASDEALQLVAVKSGSDSMRLTRARVLLAAHRPAEAITEARKIKTPAEIDELAPSIEIYRDTQEVLGFALLELNKPAAARKALQAAATSGSSAAQRYLAK